MNFSLEPARFRRALVGVVATLLLLHLVALSLVFGAGWRTDRHAVQLLALDVEHNVPSLAQGLGLALCALLLWLVARATRASGGAYVRHWSILALVFLGLALDEVLRLHERTIEPLRAGLGTRGVLYFAWVLPAAICLVALAAAYLRWFVALPPRTRWRVALSGALFVGGALGMEMAGGAVASSGRDDTLTYALMTTVEELGEMAGVALFAVTLLDHLATLAPVIGVRLGATPAAGD